ncbi:MAG: symmetrical bis(5'-nucleosyl)-tetraphosphatase [Thermoanaerobaculia bacterium]|nr:symmetrical bis(5'-nucleosyl)-tetraphosphatase [Thermoanaerobaculia bacterium]
MAATWAIGDVHGCYRSLRALLDTAGVAARDRLWFVGDLVNRGPRSLETLRFVADLGERATVVLGNHDLHFLARAAGVAPERKHDALDELLAAPDLASLVGWLKRSELLFIEGNHLLVHAGVLAAWARDAALDRARRAAAALRSTEASLYLEAFRPTSRTAGGVGIVHEVLDDLRVFTLMRTVDDAGRPTYDYTGPLDTLPAGRRPWFEVAQRGTADLRVVCGHWAAAGLIVRPDLVALDSGCAWGGQLTAMRLDDGRVAQVENRDR